MYWSSGGAILSSLQAGQTTENKRSNTSRTVTRRCQRPGWLMLTPSFCCSPTIYAVLHVAAADRVAFEAKHGFPIMETLPNGSVQVSVPKPDYAPVEFFAASDPNPVLSNRGWYG